MSLLLRLSKNMSFRASAHTGVGISWFFKHFWSKNKNFYFYLRDRHTSLRTGSR